MTSVAGERTSWLKTAALVVLIGYWLALFTATHIPRTLAELPLSVVDKLLHAGGYAVLAFLVALNWSLRGTLTWRHCLGVVVALAAWGIVDEMTQVLVGRDSDVLDWMADVLGAAAGVGIFMILASLWRSSARDVTGS